MEAGLRDGRGAVLWPPQSTLVRGKRALETAAAAVTESFLSPAVYNYTNRETECRLISLSQTEIRQLRLTGHQEEPVSKEGRKEDNLHVVLRVHILRVASDGLR